MLRKWTTNCIYRLRVSLLRANPPKGGDAESRGYRAIAPRPPGRQRVEVPDPQGLSVRPAERTAP